MSEEGIRQIDPIAIARAEFKRKMVQDPYELQPIGEGIGYSVPIAWSEMVGPLLETLDQSKDARLAKRWG